MSLRTTAWLSPILILAACIHVMALQRHFRGVDYYNFWVVPQILKEDPAANIYDLELQARTATALRQRAEKDGPPEFARVAAYRENLKLQLNGTPLQYAVLSVFYHPDYETGFRHFQIAGLILFILSILLLGQILTYSIAASLTIAGLLILFFGPVQWDILVGNVNQVHLLGIAAMLMLLQRETFARQFATGAILGFEVAFKPNFAYIAVFLFAYWLHTREFKLAARAFGGALAATVIGVAISAFYFGSVSPWGVWFNEALPVILSRSDYGTWMANFAPSQVIQELTGFNITVLTIPALIMGLVWYGFSPKKPGEPKSDMALVMAMACVLTLLFPKLVWFHYQTLFLPLIFYVFKAGEKLRAPLLLATFAIGLNPCLWDEGSYTPVWINMAGSLILLGLAIWMWRQRPVTQQPMPG